MYICFPKNIPLCMKLTKQDYKVFYFLWALFSTKALYSSSIREFWIINCCCICICCCCCSCNICCISLSCCLLTEGELWALVFCRTSPLNKPISSRFCCSSFSRISNSFSVLSVKYAIVTDPVFHDLFGDSSSSWNSLFLLFVSPKWFNGSLSLFLCCRMFSFCSFISFCSCFIYTFLCFF